MRKFRNVFFMLCICFSLTGCKKISTAETIFDDMKENANIYEELTEYIVYNEENDPNSLMGKEHNYTSKVSWGDQRIKEGEDDPYNAGTIEVFENEKDAELRKDYLEYYIKKLSETFTKEEYGEKTIQPFMVESKQFIIVKGNALMKLNGGFKDDEKKLLEDIFSTAVEKGYFDQSNVPEESKIKDLQKVNQEKIDASMDKVKKEFNKNLDTLADEYETKVADVEKNTVESTFQSVKKELSDFTAVPYYAKRYDNWKTRLDNIEIKIQEDKKRALAAKERTFSAGKYVVGSDIDAGTYDIVAVSGGGNLFVTGGSYMNHLNEILGVGDTRFYTPSYKNARLEVGQTIEIKGNLVLNFQPK